MRILYYLTAHGYGHAVRAAAIANQFSRDVQVLFRTLIPLKFFEEEVKTPFEIFPAQFDCGCIQTDSVTVDKRETLREYQRLAEENQGRLKEEVGFCRKQRVDGIVSDIPPVPFEVAREAGLPSVAVTNFTWYDIYEPYLEEYPAFEPCLRRIRKQYQMAGLLLELVPSGGMPYFQKRAKIPLVGRAGRNIQDRIKNRLGIGKRKKIALVYVGEYGLGHISWENLEKFKDWDFIGIYPLPGAPSNYHLLRKEDFRYEDLVASAEVMASKIGYGVFSECQLNGVPLIYLPRDDFAEFPVLERGLTRWGHGYRLTREDYIALRWEEVFEKVLDRKRPLPLVSDGAKICAREIENFIR